MGKNLKPCPFCGRKVRLVNVSEFGFKCDIWVIVHEEKEPICFLWHNKGYEGKKKDIVKLWNQRILKEQEPVKPKYNARTNWFECGACHYSMTSGMHCKSELIPAYKVGFCAKCGRAVKWDA